MALPIVQYSNIYEDDKYQYCEVETGRTRPIFQLETDLAIRHKGIIFPPGWNHFLIWPGDRTLYIFRKLKPKEVEPRTILDGMFEKEHDDMKLINANYMNEQQEIDDEVRFNVLDRTLWILRKLKTSRIYFYKTVYILDHYISATARKSITPYWFLCFVSASLYIALSYQTTRYNYSTYVELMDNRFHEKDLIDTVRLVLNEYLHSGHNYRSTPGHFLAIFLRILIEEEKEENCDFSFHSDAHRLLISMSYHTASYYSTKSSKLAAACLLKAYHNVNKPWSAKEESVTRYKEKDLLETMNLVQERWENIKKRKNSTLWNVDFG